MSYLASTNSRPVAVERAGLEFLMQQVTSNLLVVFWLFEKGRTLYIFDLTHPNWQFFLAGFQVMQKMKQAQVLRLLQASGV